MNLLKVLPTGLKAKAKKCAIIASILGVCYGGFHVADKYFNKAPAEANLVEHVTDLFGSAPDAVSCPQVDSGNYDGRVTCEARYGEDVKVYLCRGRFDGLDSSCISPKAAALLGN